MKNNLCAIETLIPNYHKSFDNTIIAIGAWVMGGWLTILGEEFCQEDSSPKTSGLTLPGTD